MGFYKSLSDTIETLKRRGKTVSIIAPVPESYFDVPRCLSHQALFGAAYFPCPLAPTDAYRAQQSVPLAIFNRLGSSAAIFYPSSILCGPAACQIADDGGTLYSDNNHLNAHGDALLTPGMRVFLTPVLSGGL